MLGIEDYSEYEEFNDEKVIRTVPLATGDEGKDKSFDSYRDLNFELDDYILYFLEQGFDESDLVESDSEQTIESTFGAMINILKTKGSFKSEFDSLSGKDLDLDDADKLIDNISKTGMDIRRDFA